MSFHDRLITEYCPPLDAALVSAILLDYDADPAPDDDSAIRATLDALAADANAQDVSQTTVAQHDSTGTEPSTAEVERALDAWHLDTRSSSPDDSTTSSDVPKRSDDPLSFVQSVFPGMARENLRARLDASDKDVEALVEELLSEELIAALAAEDISRAPLRDEPSALDRRKERKKQKAALKASKTIALNDVLHRAPTPSASPNPAARQLPSASTNRWATLDSTASYLAKLMHISPGRMSSAYHAADSSLPIAVHRLMLTLATERPFDALPDHEMLLGDLRIILPLSPDELRLLLSATEGDLSDAMDLHEKLRDIEAEYGNLLQNGYFGFGKDDAKGRVAVLHSDSTLEPLIPTAHIEPTYKGWKRLPEEEDTTSASLSLQTHTAADGAEPDPTTTKYTSAQCAAFAQQYLVRRNEAYRAAARHYKQGGTSSKGTGERGAAFYYADMSRQMDKKRKEWELKAAQLTVKERRVTHGNVDLHNLTLSHALTVVKDSCNEWYSSGQKEPLTIITGIGRHSTNQNAVLRPAVAKLLDREGWRWQWERGSKDSGSIIVTGTTGARVR